MKIRLECTKASWAPGGISRRQLLPCLGLLVWLSACTHTEFASPRAQLDLSPVGCGYRWFQTGYSSDIQMSCQLDRSTIRDDQMVLAAQNAWEVAEQRCPVACPPVELQDTVVWENPSPNGVCKNNVVYFYTRVFFSCAGAN